MSKKILILGLYILSFCTTVIADQSARPIVQNERKCLEFNSCSRSECYAMFRGTMSSTPYVLYPMTDEVSDALSRLSTNTTFCANGRIENNVINLLETRRFYILSISDE